MFNDKNSICNQGIRLKVISIIYVCMYKKGSYCKMEDM
jgi:hypothetical protein